MALSLLT
jgi:hypothetical protein